MDFVKLARDAERGSDMATAEKLYRKAIADRDAHAYNNLAQLLAIQGRLEEVEGLFRQGVAAGDSLSAKNLVLYLLEQGKESAARQALKRAREMGRVPIEAEIAGSRAYAARVE